MRNSRLAPLGAMVALVLAQSAMAAPPGQVKDDTIQLPQLQGPARIVRDVDGMPHIYAHNERDALFLQGWVQAQDRLFQIDVLRRQASGTLAELVGSGALGSDAELQVIGLARAAERSLNALSPATRAGLQAYADGVNAWVARNPLPAQYAALQVTKFKPWTALDCAIIGKALAFNLSFDLDDGATTTFQTYVGKLGAQGQAAFFLDVFRSAPFDKAATIPDATGKPPFLGALKAAPAAASAKSAANASGVESGGPALQTSDVAALRDLRRRYEAVPFLHRTLNRTAQQIGSNEWAVSGSLTSDGRPLVANDPHLGLDLPATFYQLQIVGQTDGFDAIGSSVTGTPWIVLGQNRFVTWGETTTGFDVTDMYVDQLAPAPTASGLVSVHKDGTDAVTRIPLSFKVNLLDGLANGPDTILTLAPGQFGTPKEVLTLARRNNGPVVADLDGGRVVTVQYTGFSGTRELETFRLLNHARNLEDFKTALQYFDVGSQNFIYGDLSGNIGYFTTGEVPLREDLQLRNQPTGAPPWFVRDGFGGNEWLKDPSPDQFNGTGYLSLPFEEMPQTVNPRNGWVINANNDTSGATLDNNPLNQLRVGGQGIYFLGYTFDFGTRAGRITQALEERLAQGPVDRGDMKAIQADVKLLDAQVFTPYITGAFDRARAAGAPAALAALAADARIAEAVGRLAAWNHTTPTGVATGYDAADVDGQLAPPSQQEIAHSVAATIYSVWRGQAINNAVDRKLDEKGVPRPGSGEAIKALRHLVERNGLGLSGLDFFDWVGFGTPEQKRDYVMLRSLQDALNLLAGPAFAKAYGNSTNQDDYRWGKLHRIVFDGLVVEGPFSIPNPQLGFPPSFPTLAGLATDGGFGVVDASSHSARAASADAFMFSSGPNRRYVGSPGTAPGSTGAETSLPGGMSGVLGSPFYANLLGRWLTNDTYPLRTGQGEVMQAIHSQQQFKPANPGRSSTAPNNNNGRSNKAKAPKKRN
jgi:penicillin amidase